MSEATGEPSDPDAGYQGRGAAVRRAAQRTRQRGTRGRAGRTTSVRGFRAGPGRTVRRDRRLLVRRRRRAGRRRGHLGAQRSGGRRPAGRGDAGDPGRAGVADPHGGADSRGSLGGQSDTALVALGAAPGHLSRGEGPVAVGETAEAEPNPSGRLLDGQGRGQSATTVVYPIAACGKQCRWTGVCRWSARAGSWCYCLAMAMRRRSSGLMRWSWSSTSRSIWTQRTRPLKRLSLGP